ncbi:MAG: hypothetical protein JWO52_5424 [Gammaproteobacteria bacterium]|nr:hypothetical protein [Gammaproteobacteria bacterium]
MKISRHRIDSRRFPFGRIYRRPNRQQSISGKPSARPGTDSHPHIDRAVNAAKHAAGQVALKFEESSARYVCRISNVQASVVVRLRSSRSLQHLRTGPGPQFLRPVAPHAAIAPSHSAQVCPCRDLRRDGTEYTEPIAFWHLYIEEQQVRVRWANLLDRVRSNVGA